MVFFCYPASKFNKCPKCGQDLVLIPREHSIFGICKTKICRKKEKKMDKKFMYNFKKVGSEYVPETNRVNYDDILSDGFEVPSFDINDFNVLNELVKKIDSVLSEYGLQISELYSEYSSPVELTITIKEKKETENETNLGEKQ